MKRVLIAIALTLLFLTPAHSEELPDLIIQHHFEFIPSGDGPFPTLVAMPGCSGIAFTDAAVEAAHPDLREDDRLFRRHYLQMSERLSNHGFAVLLINVHAVEGVLTACGGEIEAERIAAYIDESIGWAQTLSFVDPMQLHVIGWSMGGGGVMAWLHGPRSSAPAVNSLIAVYPACRGREDLTISAPVLMLLGGADDIAEPSVCKALVERSPIQASISTHIYPGARHGFDIVDAPPMLAINDSMSVGYHKDAAEAAWLEILSFLEQE